MEGCTNREGIFWKGSGWGRAGDDGNMAEPGGHLARKALRRRKPQAAGVNARPTLWLGMGGDTEEAVVRQAWRRADASIGPYAGGRGSAADRKGIGGARCGTPPSPAATPPLAGEAFEGAAARCSRFCGPCALCCRAGVHARRGRGCSDGDRVGLMQRLAPQYTAMPQGPAAGEIAHPTLRPKTGGDP